MPRKPIFTESTSVPATRSISEIHQLLIQAGAKQISYEYNGHHEIAALTFSIPFGRGMIPYRLPARIYQVLEKINGSRIREGDRERYANSDRNQAERITWRQLYWWLKAQLALIDLGMCQPEEVLMPYRVDDSGQTMFEHYNATVLHKLLPAPER